LLKRTVTIVNKLGLHARAAASFVETALAFESEIRVKSGERSIDGKSIMGLMMLAAATGTSLELTVYGSDEETAMRTLAQLIENRFGEEL